MVRVVSNPRYPAVSRIGTSPAHTGRSRSPSSSIGPPVRTLAEPSVIGIRTINVAAQLLGRRAPGVGAAPGREMVEQRRGHRLQLGFVGHALGAAEEHDAAVVHRVVERGAGEHEAVEERDRHADLRVAGEIPQHVVARGTVEVELIADAHVRHRQHHGPVLGRRSRHGTRGLRRGRG